MLTNERVWNVTGFFLSASCLLFRVHLDFLTGKTQSWAVQDEKELTLSYRFVFALVVSPSRVLQALSRSQVLSVAVLQPAFSVPPTVWIPWCENTWPVLTFSWRLWKACEPRQTWFPGFTLCEGCLLALPLSVPYQIFLKGARALITEYCEVEPNSVVLACAEFSLKPIVVGKMR